MSQFRRHVFVCTSGKVCPRQGAAEVLERLKRGVFAAGKKNEIRVNKAGCFGQCGHGPMVVCYPEAVWYGAVTPELAERLLEDHILGGKPCPERQFQPPGTGVQLCPPGAEPITPSALDEPGDAAPAPSGTDATPPTPR